MTGIRELRPGDRVQSVCFGLAEVVDAKGHEVLLKHCIGRTKGGKLLYAEHIDERINCIKVSQSDENDLRRLW